MAPVIKWNQKHSSKQVVSIKCTLHEKFFVAANFEGLWDVSSETEKKSLQWTLSFLCISREQTIKQILFMESKFNFLYADI